MSDQYTIFPHVLDVSKNFSGVLLDAYGVFWGGNDVGVLKGSVETMQNLMESGKTVGILSNSTQLAEKEINKFARHGIHKGKHFHFIITSGEVAKNLFTNEKLPFETINKKYWLFGGIHPKFSSHAGLFQDSPYVETQTIQEADFIYISIPHLNGEDQLDPDCFKSQVDQLIPFGKPMICANPDRFAHEGNPPKAVVRQGSIAALYQASGGEVFYIGKPSASVFNEAMHHFSRHNVFNPKDILMVGDSVETDVKGARSFGMPVALVTKTGIMAERIANEGFINVVNTLSSLEIPNYFIERLAHGL